MDDVAGQPAASPDRILTVPNAISALRLLGVPIFLWLALGPQADGVAFAVLAAASISDWLDGKLARALGQTSRLGELLDPAADRLYIAATVVALAIRGAVPWWLVALLAVRELALAGVLARLRAAGWGPLQVHYLGKAATLSLLYAFPLLYLGLGSGLIAEGARVIGWAFAIWGTLLYWWAGALYASQAGRLLREDDETKGVAVCRPA